MKSDVKEFDKSSLVMRLERNQNDLRQLKSTLNSYICEPRTYSLFERIESLRHGLEDLSNTNTEIIQSLKGRKKSISNYVERAKKQFQEFNNLQRNVEDYVAGVRNC